ncbi:hypothetical protein MLD38_006693 [Melastoma candidum]|uniref:Uncharacterized protein n=1 Tax=Melastoma candidum TaxID=119954 RepID=A0ACB9RPZ6_9MYRT|nr:hypothetical protein MLD38_006693 [Melastoma candidum]
MGIPAELYIPSNVPEKLLYKETLYYGELDNVRRARRGQLDGNRLRFSCSLGGQAPGDGTAFMGGLGYGNGAMGLFNTPTGELRCKFGLYQGDWISSYTAWALAFSSDAGRPLGDANRLQWSIGHNRLLVATLFPTTANCFISLLDYRQKDTAWNWTDIWTRKCFDENQVHDVIAIQGTKTECTVDNCGSLEFMDLRRQCGSRDRAVIREDLRQSLRSQGGQIYDLLIDGNRLFALHSKENVFDIWETPPSILYELKY